MRIFFSYIYFLFFLVNSSQAKMVLDTILLPEVKLIESRVITHNIGSKIHNFKTADFNEGSSVNLASVINRLSSVYIKTYGALSTASSRGTSSSHTLVVWNGIPINSIANGLTDFSSIYCSHFSDIIIVNGGDGSVFGSGALGGSLHLNSNQNLLNQQKSLFSLSRGSYGLKSTSFNISMNYKKLTARLSLNEFYHDNNFEYVDITKIERPLSINEYGKKKSNNHHLDMFYTPNSNTNYKLSIWLSNLEREVSQNMTTTFSDAMQYDNSSRILMSLNHNIKNININIKQAYLNEEFRYTEVIKDIDSYYNAKSYISDLDLKFLKGNYLLNIGSAFINNKINNNNYSSFLKTEKKLAVFTALQYKFNSIAINNVLRKEWHSAFEIPLIPTLALDFQLNNLLKLRAKYNRNFRSPTFNDRFWVGSGSRGNPNLKSEDAWNQEIGIDFFYNNNIFSITGYYLKISDMIIWQEMENGMWIPNNIKQVSSRGIEVSTKLTFNNINFVANYILSKSTNENRTDNLDNTLGQQLRYVPIHKTNFSVNMDIKEIQLSLVNSYTDKVITSYAVPENKTLDSYFLTDFSVKYIFDFFPLSVEGKIKNLMNKSYITYQNYPNPGRELLLTINYIIN